MSNDQVKEYKVEYLCTLDKGSDFCSSINGLKSLLESYEKLKINKNKIMWKGHEFDLKIDHGAVLNSNYNFFHLTLVNKNESIQKIFLDLLRVIRTILSKVNDNRPPEILWDDMSSEYAMKSYPILHELENLMRKLITKFMITKVGLTWTRENIPDIVKTSLRTKENRNHHNYIYDTDFIQLSNFLFKEYSNYNENEYIKNITKANKLEDLNFDEIKKIVPQSNWTRYFEPILKTNSDDIKARWDKLYDLRCKVAHNNFMYEEDYKNILDSSSHLKKIILDAIINLDAIRVSEDDKEDLAENAAINLTGAYGDYIVKYRILSNILAKNFNFSQDKKNISNLIILENLKDSGLVSIKDYNEFKFLTRLRNLIVHQVNIDINEDELFDLIERLDSWKVKLEKLGSSINRKTGWFEVLKNEHDQVYFILKDSNNEVLFFSNGYNDKVKLTEDINIIKDCIPSKINFKELTSDDKGMLEGNLYIDDRVIGNLTNIPNHVIALIRVMVIRNIVKNATIIFAN